MEDQVECFVSGTLATILLVSKFLGLAPLRFVRIGKGWRITLSSNLYVVGCFFVIATNVTIILAVVNEMLYHHLGLTQTRRVTWAIEIFMVMTTWTVMVFSTSSHMRCLIASMNQVQKITSNLKIRHWVPQWKKTQIGLFMFWIIICNAVFFSTAFCIFSSSIISQETIYIRVAFVFFYVDHCGIQLGTILFIQLVLHVRSSFKAINHCLKILLRDIEKKQVHVEKIGLRANTTFKKINNYIDALADPKEIYSDNQLDTNSISHLETVRGIASAYACACGVVRAVNRSYGLMLMVLLTGFFLYLVTKPYYFISNLVAESGIKSQSRTHFILKQMSGLFWIVFHLTNLAMFIEPCHLTHTEIERTRELVGWLVVHADPAYDDLAVELEQFCTQFALDDVSYKPLQVTMMTRGLVLTILGSITTYLVILVNINK